MLAAMKIDAAAASRLAALRRRTPVGPAGGSFAAILDEVGGETASAPAAAATAVAPADALLALQAVDEDTYNRQRARQRADGLLDRLDDLRRHLLVGQVPLERLNHLAALVASYRPAVADPRLQGVLEDIDLRVQVELAKLRR